MTIETLVPRKVHVTIGSYYTSHISNTILLVTYIKHNTMLSLTLFSLCRFFMVTSLHGCSATKALYLLDTGQSKDDTTCMNAPKYDWPVEGVTNVVQLKQKTD